MTRSRSDEGASGRPEEPSPTQVAEAFEAAVREHYVRLSRFEFRILHSWDAAEDAVQEALLKSWARRESINLQDPLPYLYQAVRNQCLMAVRRDRRWVDSRRVPATDEAQAPAADRTEALEAAVSRAIEALPERARQVFTMSREQQLTYAQIADLLGISVKTVETHMGRALKALRLALADHLDVVTLLAASGAAHSLFR